MIDQGKKTALIEHIKEQQKSGAAEILLSPDLYFDGYDDDCCDICTNNRNPVSTSQFAARLRELQERPDVLAVFVRFYEYDDALEDADLWIGSDSVCVITNASLTAVRDWFDDFEVCDVWEENYLANFPGLPEMAAGFRLVAVWWD